MQDLHTQETFETENIERNGLEYSFGSKKRNSFIVDRNNRQYLPEGVTRSEYKGGSATFRVFQDISGNKLGVLRPNAGEYSESSLQRRYEFWKALYGEDVVSTIYYRNTYRFIMPVIEGTLLTRVKFFGIRKQYKFYQELLTVVAKIHAAGFVYCDLHEGNLVSQKDGSLAVIDGDTAVKINAKVSSSAFGFNIPQGKTLEQVRKINAQNYPWMDSRAFFDKDQPETRPRARVQMDYRGIEHVMRKCCPLMQPKFVKTFGKDIDKVLAWSTTKVNEFNAYECTKTEKELESILSMLSDILSFVNESIKACGTDMEARADYEQQQDNLLLIVDHYNTVQLNYLQGISSKIIFIEDCHSALTVSNVDYILSCTPIAQLGRFSKIINDFKNVCQEELEEQVMAEAMAQARVALGLEEAVKVEEVAERRPTDITLPESSVVVTEVSQASQEDGRTERLRSVESESPDPNQRGSDNEPFFAVNEPEANKTDIPPTGNNIKFFAAESQEQFPAVVSESLPGRCCLIS